MTHEKTYNVTNLTPEQRKKLFTDCMNQTGFTAFIKNQNKKQTHYTFQYTNLNQPQPKKVAMDKTKADQITD